MRTEAFKSLDHGFLLSEVELRRLIDIIHTQMKRACDGRDPQFYYLIKFDNGAVSTTKTLDDVLGLENFGSGAVTRLEVIAVDDSKSLPETKEAKLPDYLEFPQTIGEDSKFLIRIRFVDRNGHSTATVKPISYGIIGQDRDWVFVTSSQLEERISKIKVISFNKLTSIKALSVVFPFLFLIVFGLILLPTVSSETHRIDNIQHEWQMGKMKDPIAVMIALERARTFNPSLTPFLLVTILYAVSVAIPVLLAWAYPPYTFYWGDRIASYDKRKSVRSIVFVGILVALIVSIIGGYIVNKFRLGL